MISFARSEFKRLTIATHLVALMLVVAVTCDRGVAQDEDSESIDRFLASQQARIQAIEKAKKATISVFAPSGNNGGSGVIISPDGFAITNYHVVKPCGNFMKCSLPNGNLYDAVLVGIDPVGDVALIRLFGEESFPVADIADSRNVRVGDHCFAVGNPFLLATDFQPTVTYGIVSGVNRYQFPAGTLLEYTDCIQTDAAINPGNSGGPLFNAEGQLIGINGRGSFEKRGRVNVGVGYAISINQVKLFLGCLHSGRILDHATLGATVSYDANGKIVISNMLSNTDAWRRGIRIGDEVLFFGDRQIDSVNAFKNVLGIYPRGFKVPLTYRRDGEEITTMVRLSGVHSQEELLELVQAKPTDAPDGQPNNEPNELPSPQDPAPEVRDMFESRAGFANYHFNRTQLERVWSSLKILPNGGWNDMSIAMKGRWNDETDLEVTLSERGSGLLLGGESAELIDENIELGQQLGPEGSGGMLLAFHIWYRMMREGPERFGDVYYFGRAPYQLPETDSDLNLHDVLIGTFDTIESRWFISESGSQIDVLEMFPDIAVDPCELHFSNYQSVDGYNLPHTIEVKFGDGVFGTFEVGEIRLRPNQTQE